MSNVNFYVYEKNGKIVKIGSLPEEDIVNNIHGEQQFSIGIASTSSQYVENGILKDMPTKPEGEYVFNYDTKQWEFDAVVADIKAKQQRDRLLADGPDRISPMWWSSMSEQEQQAWTFYRQALLDITEQADYPEFIVWPIKP